MELSLRWAERSKRAHEGNDAALFGIVQGGMYEAQRQRSAAELVRIGFDGYAIGGLSVGEPHEERDRVLDCTVPALPADRPRYLMGVGRPEDIIAGVLRGVDMFDCVMPTRNARNGYLFTSRGGSLPGDAGCAPDDAAQPDLLPGPDEWHAGRHQGWTARRFCRGLPRAAEAGAVVGSPLGAIRDTL